MPGGLMQLSAFGAESQYLSGNPQLNFFKMVYRRYSNFAMESIELPLNGSQQLSPETSTKLYCRIDRHADLVSHLYFRIQLPDIYSGYYANNSEDNFSKSGYQFQWIESIGTNMIEKTYITIGGTKINELYGEWIAIWHELFSFELNVDIFNKMIGNIPELYDPASLPENKGIYPTSTLDPTLNKDPELFTSSTILSNPYLKAPSIKGRQLIIPLNFWFTMNPGLALPLIALQYHEVHVHVELRPLSELYTIKEPKENSDNFEKRIKPDINQADHLITNFLANISPLQFKRGNSFAMENNSTIGNTLFVQPNILANYIFLEEKDQKRFAKSSHEYLIEQVVRREFRGIYGSKMFDLTLNHPVKSLVWYAQRDDFVTNNIFSNYTNWPDKNINPSSLSFYQTNFGEIRYELDLTGTPVATDPLEIAFQNNSLVSKFNFKNYEKDILKEVKILFNGIERFSSQTSNFYSLLQPYQHKYTNIVPGVQTYSFALDPRKRQPNGAVNLSRVKNIQMHIETAHIDQEDNANPTLTHKFKYNIYVYAINYNLFRVFAGMGGLSFS